LRFAPFAGDGATAGTRRKIRRRRAQSTGFLVFISDGAWICFSLLLSTKIFQSGAGLRCWWWRLAVPAGVERTYWRRWLWKRNCCRWLCSSGVIDAAHGWGKLWWLSFSWLMVVEGEGGVSSWRLREGLDLRWRRRCCG
jgi:hypothetical protein